MPRAQKFIPSLQSLLVASAFSVLVGCGGEGSPVQIMSAPTVTVTSLDDATTPVERRDVPTTESEDSSLCTNAAADPDGDGWGWENHNPCVVESQSTTGIANNAGDNLPVGILYFLWHCQATSAGRQINITEVLNGQSDWGNTGVFHWWDKPAEGYYCLGDQPELISRHLTLLRDAGVDFLVLDITNHPNTASFGADTFILKSLRPLLEVARTIPGAPKIVPWVPFTNDNSGTVNERANACNANGNSTKCQNLQQAVPMYQHVTELLANEFPELVFEYDGKPLLLETANDNTYPRAETDLIRPALETNWTVERMWGLSLDNTEWQFLSTCSNPLDFYESNGWSENGCNQPVNAGEQISVSAAYQYTYISEPFTQAPQSHAGFTGGMPKFYGRTLAQQFRVAFENRDAEPLVILTGWNEWIAQRFELDGRTAFVDLYNDNLNRDIEPGGESGDLYYYLMRDLIQQYRKFEHFSFADYFLTKETILDTDFYWENHTDLQSAFAKDDTSGLLNHWLTIGIHEGRQPSVAFELNYYRDSYSDLANAGIVTPAALLNHFIDFGFQEGRQGSADFHAPSYLGRYSDIAGIYGNNGYYKSFRHYLNFGQALAQNARP